MDDAYAAAGGDPLKEALVWCQESVADLQGAFAALSKHAANDIVDDRSLAAFARTWRTVVKRRRRVQMLLADLDGVVEDIYDSVDAQKAREEPGESVPWEQVKAELGLQ